MKEGDRRGHTQQTPIKEDEEHGAPYVPYVPCMEDRLCTRVVVKGTDSVLNLSLIADRSLEWQEVAEG